MKRQLSQEEHEKVERGEGIMNTDDGSPSAFVVEGLELEETQCIIRINCSFYVTDYKLLIDR